MRLLHADVLGALASNPLTACGVMGFVAGGLVAPVWLACGGQAPCLPTRPSPAWSAAFAVTFLANWAWLYVSGV